MQPDQLRQLLDAIKSGSTSVDAAFLQLATLPFGDLGDAKVDHHRALRCGFAEVIFCRGKEPRDVVRIVEEGLRAAPCMLATRAEKRHIDAIKERYPGAIVNARGGTVRVGSAMQMKTRGSIMVVTAGTSDIPVAEEALETLRAFGCEGYHSYDVGVAGLHRVIAVLPKLREAAVIICVAGMEGALPSVVGGLVACPVIAVPTSIGYGASFNGAAALLGMLNTCASGVTVVNIDNGFGAAMSALRIIADREWPIVEVKQPAAAISEEEHAAAKAGLRDEQFVRLEKIVERLAALASTPAAAVERTSESNSAPKQEQVARLERAVAELTAVVLQRNELAEKHSGEKIPVSDDMAARLERAVENLAAIAARPLVVEVKQPLPASHPEPAVLQSERDQPVPAADTPVHERAEKSSVVKSAPKGKKNGGSKSGRK